METKIKWEVSKLLIEFENYEDLINNCNETDNDLNELDDDDELNREDRFNIRKKLKIKKKNLLHLIEEKEELLSTSWNNSKDKILDDNYMKTISNGDTYFMATMFRVRKEYNNMIKQK